MQERETFLMPTYHRLPVRFSRGRGAYLWDDRGNTYLDAISGVAVTNLGHAHPEIARVLYQQAQRLVHTSNLVEIQAQEDIAERLCRLSGMERVFFCNSGAEANETAIKLARLHAGRRQIGNPVIVVMENSFHGRTLATLSASGNEKIQRGYEPLVQGFLRIPFNRIDALEELARTRPEIVAVLVEPVQGEGGVRPAMPGYLEQVRSLCDRHDWLMMLDEIQTGLGRTGAWFAYQHTSVRPDVVTLAKALANGLPIGACLASGAAAGLFAPGGHGSTFGGNPLACRAALEVLHIIERDGLVARSATLGDRLRRGLGEQLRGIEGVREVRGLGLMIGIEMDQPCNHLMEVALTDERMLINVTRDYTIRLLPAMIMTKSEIDDIIRGIGRLVSIHC
ncbi:MAG: aspartate aminotransferase family protein, partial [Dechloromonas sp.]|nr:aspartate aminotransferase family protein [Dechloromonas sp.]